MIGVRPPDAPQDPGLPILAAGNGRPLIDADDMRFDRLPDVDIGVTDDVDDVAVPGIGAHRLGDLRFLRPLHQVIGEDSHPMVRIGAERRELVGDVIEAAQGFDDDAFDAQIVAPDLLDQFGIVFALDPDARSACHPCLGTCHGTRTRGSASSAGRLLLRRQAEIDRLTLEEESRPEGEGPNPALPVLEVDDDTGRGLLGPDDGPDVSAHRILEDHAQSDLDGAGLLRPVRGRGVTGEDIGAIAIESIHRHPP